MNYDYAKLCRRKCEIKNINNMLDNRKKIFSWYEKIFKMGFIWLLQKQYNHPIILIFPIEYYAHFKSLKLPVPTRSRISKKIAYLKFFEMLQRQLDAALSTNKILSVHICHWSEFGRQASFENL